MLIIICILILIIVVLFILLAAMRYELELADETIDYLMKDEDVKNEY